MQEIAKPLRLKPECISCMLRSKLEAYPEEVSTEKKLEYMQRVLREISEVQIHHSAPVVVRTIAKIRKEMFGYEEDYTEIKRHFNQLMMGKVSELRERLEVSEDALKLGIQYAMTGNYIDFGAVEHVDENQLQKFLDDAKDIPVNEEEYQALQKDIDHAKSIAFLTDNCGEIVMDKLLIEMIQKRNPEAEITVIVRGKDVLNDATMDDAKQVGLTEMVRVIGNGSDIGGTCLEEISEESRNAIDSADVILAKGQGNFETLQNCGKNIYYIFMCKCEMFAKRFQVPRFYGMLINDKNCAIL